MKDLISLLADESFQNWLSGKGSPSEREKWESWKNHSAENQELHKKAVDFWQSLKFGIAEPPDLDLEWDKLKAGLILNQKSVETTQSFFSHNRPSRQHHRRDNRKRFGVVAFAASILLAVISWFISFQQEVKLAKQETYQLVSTEFGQRATINLPEGTEIVLNANSTLKYPAVWKEFSDYRFELKGEAYFVVSKSSDVPRHDFIVHTTDGTIRVTGTRFVVYERGKGTRVVVEEGGVEVSSDDSRLVDLDSLRKTMLNPGSLLQFTKGKQLSKPIPVNINPFVTWWKNAMILEQTPFREIVQRLEETYGVTVKVPDKRLLQRTLSGSIENQNLVIVTDALANALKVPVRREGEIVIFGSGDSFLNNK